MASVPVIRQCLGDSFNLFKCYENPGHCVLSCVCPCNTSGHVAAKKGKNCCLWGAGTLVPILGCYILADLRTKVKGGPLWEQCIVGGCLCAPCSLCEIGRKETSCDDLTKVSAIKTSGQQAMK